MIHATSSSSSSSAPSLWQRLVSASHSDWRPLQELASMAEEDLGSWDVDLFREAGGMEGLAAFLILVMNETTAAAERKAYAAWALSGLVGHISGFGDTVAETKKELQLAFNLSQMLSGTNEIAKQHACRAIATLTEKVGGFGEAVSVADEAIGWKLSELLLSTNRITKSQAARAIANLVEMVPGFGESIFFCDRSLASKLGDLLTSSNDSTKTNATRAIANLVDNVSGFGIALKKSVPNLALKFCALLMCEDMVTKSNAVSAVASLVDDVDAFGVDLISANPEIGSLLVGLLSSSDNCDSITSGNVVRAIGCLVDRVPDFGKTLSSSEDTLGSKLCELLSSSDDITKANAATTLSNLILSSPDFGYGIATSDPMLASKLCTLLDSKDEITKSNGANAITIMSQCVSGFASAVAAADSSLASKLCQLMAEGDEIDKNNAARAISTLADGAPGFGEEVCAADPELGLKLCDLLTFGNDNTKSNCIRAIISLIKTVSDFGSMVTAADSRLGAKLCGFLGSRDDAAVCNAAWAIGGLVEQVEEFGFSIVSSDPSVGSKLVHLLVHEDDGIKGNAAWAIGSLVRKISGFAEAIVAMGDVDLGKKLVQLLINDNDGTRCNAAWTIGSLVRKVPEFGVKITATEPRLARRLCDLLSGNNSNNTVSHAASTIAVLTETVEGFADGVVVQVLASPKVGNRVEGDEEDVGTKLCELLTNPNDVIKCNAAMTIALLVENVPEFGSSFVEMNPHAAAILDSLAEHSDFLLAGWANRAVDAIRTLTHPEIEGNADVEEAAYPLQDGLQEELEEPLEEIKQQLQAHMIGNHHHRNEDSANGGNNNKQQEEEETELEDPLQQPVEIQDSDVTVMLFFKERLGSGKFGPIFRGEYQGQDVAIRCISYDLSNDAVAQIKQEASLLKSEYLVETTDIVVSGTNPMVLVTAPLMDRGCLFKVLHDSIQYPDSEFSASLRRGIALDAAMGLAFLHRHHVLHRDLTSHNIVIDGNWRARLCGFGMSQARAEIAVMSSNGHQRLEDEEEVESVNISNIRHLAPELLSLRPLHSEKSDVYSLGVTFWELWTRKIPFANAHYRIVQQAVMSGEREDLDGAPGYIEKCWDQDPECRPTADQVVKWIQTAAESSQNHQNGNKLKVLQFAAMTGLIASVALYRNNPNLIFDLLPKK